MPQRYGLYLDGICGNRRIQEAAFVQKMVTYAAKLAEMRVLNLTTSFIEEDLDKLGLDHFEDEGGISCSALLSTSHCTLHVWPARMEFMFDLVSCKHFIHAVVEQALMRELSIRKVLHYDAVYPDCPGVRPACDLAAGGFG